MQKLVNIEIRKKKKIKMINELIPKFLKEILLTKHFLDKIVCFLRT